MTQVAKTSPPAFYRGRLAPTPSGLLHLGHARTFWKAFERAESAGGRLLLRIDDLDRTRCRPEYIESAIEDLHWLGIRWDEGPDIGGPFGPYRQSERLGVYLEAFRTLRNEGRIFPCRCSRKDVLSAPVAPHASDDEPIYPGTCRPTGPIDRFSAIWTGRRVTWRFRVPDGVIVTFRDGRMGPQEFVGGRDFGDFVVWTGDDCPSYQLACVCDDAAMQITEVVRGDDLIRSTARQMLIFQALSWVPPAYFHCQLVTDRSGRRLSKRDDSSSLQTLRRAGVKPEMLLQSDFHPSLDRVLF